MSGGSFDYAYYKISDFGDSLEAKLLAYDPDDWNTEFVKSLDPSTVALLKQIAKEAQTLGPKARAVEWLFSGDYGEQTFLDVISKIEQK
jgi:hypothetical protein